MVSDKKSRAMTAPDNGYMRVAKIDGVRIADFYREADAIIQRRKKLKG